MTRQKTQANQKRRGFVTAVRGMFGRRGRADTQPPAAPPRARRGVRDLITEKFGQDAYDKAMSPSTRMAHALTAKPVYQGTVAKAVVERRRAANKRARVARRIHRQRAGR